MCDWYPGPRCVTHARKARDEAQAELSKRLPALLASGKPASLADESRKLLRTQLDFYGTPTGRKELAADQQNLDEAAQMLRSYRRAAKEHCVASDTPDKTLNKKYADQLLEVGYWKAESVLLNHSRDAHAPRDTKRAEREAAQATHHLDTLAAEQGRPPFTDPTSRPCPTCGMRVPVGATHTCPPAAEGTSSPSDGGQPGTRQCPDCGQWTPADGTHTCPTPAGDTSSPTDAELIAALPTARIYSDIDREQRVEAMKEDLENAIGEMLAKDNLGDYLAMLTRSNTSRFSFSNQLFALMQVHQVRAKLPDDDPYKNAPPQLMTAAAWKKEYGAYPKKGSRAVWVWRPKTITVTDTDPKTGQEVKQQRVVGFAPLAQFDVSQMNGDKLPAPAPLPSMGKASTAEVPPGVLRGLTDRVSRFGYQYQETEIPGSDPANNRGTLGYTTPTGQIVIDSRSTPAQRTTTLMHELGHVANGHMEHIDEYRTHRGRMETEAEATAYMLARTFGMPKEQSDRMSGAYITSWSGGDREMVSKALTRATAAYNKIMEGVWPDTDHEDETQTATSS